MLSKGIIIQKHKRKEKERKKERMKGRKEGRKKEGDDIQACVCERSVCLEEKNLS